MLFSSKLALLGIAAAISVDNLAPVRRDPGVGKHFVHGVPLVTWAYSAETAQVAVDSKRLAVWEAEKDYQLYCQGLEVLP